VDLNVSRLGRIAEADSRIAIHDHVPLDDAVPRVVPEEDGSPAEPCGPDAHETLSRIVQPVAYITSMPPM